MMLRPGKRALLAVPAYNEGGRLPLLLAGAADVLAERDDIDVLVADDGSREADSRAMRSAVEALERTCALAPGRARFARHEHNRGKGAVLRDAFAAHAGGAVYDALGFLDADGSTPFAEGVRLVDLLRQHSERIDVYVGCRLKCLGIPVERQLSRHLTGRIFATLLSNIFHIPVYDSQCGAKVFKASVLTPELLALCDDQKWLFDTQLLIALWARGARLREEPVSWRETPGSKVSLLRDPPRMAAGLLRFRRRLRAFGVALPPQPSRRV